MTCICCSQGLHRGCQRWACDCPCQKRNWWDQAVYHVWKAWDRLSEKALQVWEIPVSTPDPLIKNPARESAESASQRTGSSCPAHNSLVEAPVPSLPHVAPAAAEPPDVAEAGTASAPGGGREADPLEEYWRAKVADFDMRHPSLLGPL